MTETQSTDAPAYTLIKTSTNSHKLVQQPDGSYRLACTPQSAKLPRGEKHEEGATYQAYSWNGEEFVPRVDDDGNLVRFPYQVVCHRCNGVKTGRYSR